MHPKGGEKLKSCIRCQSILSCYMYIGNLVLRPKTNDYYIRLSNSAVTTNCVTKIYNIFQGGREMSETELIDMIFLPSS